MNAYNKLKLIAWATFASLTIGTKIYSMNLPITVPYDAPMANMLRENFEAGLIDEDEFNRRMEYAYQALVYYDRGITTGKAFFDAIAAVRPDLDRHRLSGFIRGHGSIRDTEELLVIPKDMNPLGVVIYERKQDAAPRI